MPTKLFALTFIIPLFISSVGYTASNDSLKIIEKKNKKFLKKSAYVQIPAGQLSTMAFITDTDRKWVTQSNEIPRFNEVEIKSFIMKKGEVTNIEYLEFLAYSKANHPKTFQSLLPDTLVWRDPLSYNAPYIEYYLRHQAYSNYPVVGISHQQAKLYCEWLTTQYNQDPDRVFKKVIYRLPTEVEWIYAANGGNNYATYPWKGGYIRASNGDLMANCLHFGTEGVFIDTLYKKQPNGEFKEVYIYCARPDYYSGATDESLNIAADVTAPAISYYPNGFGLYNMAGNVSEMLAEPGITHGGSWHDSGHYLKNYVRQFYEGEHSASANRGFRYVIEVLEY